ncbi:exodeoxyribonuclease V subunit alpha [Georgenia muralis]
MTATTATADAADPRRALRATGLLADFNTAGVLGAADVHVASRLGRLTGETDERVLLAVALAVRGVRAGSVCVSLDDRAALADAEQEVAVEDLPWPDGDAWVRAIEASRLVAVGVDGDDSRPVRWAGDRLYLDRYWRQELLVRRAVDARLGAGVLDVDGAALAAAVGRFFPARDDARQRLAAAAAALGRFTVLTGGPGTGKTTTVARMVAVLQEVAGPGLRVALAAPTGKAAARLQESVRAELVRLAGGAEGRDAGSRDAATISGSAPAAVATTIHRLLGWRPDSSTRFRHDDRHHLPHDVVVVDETSMVSLPLMAHLLEALRPDARLVLVGDPDQLASVEAGAVLGDLVHRAGRPGPGPAEALGAVVPGDMPEDAADLRVLRSGVVRLEKVHRQERDSAILPLAAAVRAGDADAVLGLLRAGGAGVSFVETSGERPTEAELAALRADVAGAGADIVTAAGAGDAAVALRALARHRVMVAHRRGPFGVAHWSHQVEQWVEEAMGARERARARSAHDGVPRAGVRPTGTPWYPGRPLLVTTNDRDSGLYNGDTGVVVADGRGGVIAVFGDPAAPLAVRPHRLPEVETVHAMTVHRGQGSQFEQVSLVLPPATSPLLTRELLYTAVTRATTTVRVVGTEEAVRKAVTTPVRRASGLREDLA